MEGAAVGVTITIVRVEPLGTAALLQSISRISPGKPIPGPSPNGIHEPNALTQRLTQDSPKLYNRKFREYD